MLKRLQKAAWIAAFASLAFGFSVAVWSASSGRNPSDSNSPEERAYRDKAHERHSAVRNWITHDAAGFFTFWLVVVGFGQAGLFVWQLILIGQSLRDAKIAAEAAKESADTAKIQAETAGKTLEVMQDTAQRQLLAYVFIVSCKFEPPQGVGEVRLTLLIKNTGQTPAYKVYGWANIIAASNPSTPEDERRLQAPIARSDEFLAGSLGPGADLEKPLWLTPNDKADRESIERIQKGEIPYVFGEIVYIDAFGKERWTKFRFRIVGGKLAVCEKGNDAT